MPSHLSLYNEQGFVQSHEIILPGDFYGKRTAFDDNGEKKILLIHCPPDDTTTDIYFIDKPADLSLAQAQKVYELEDGSAEEILVLQGELGRMVLIAEHSYLFSSS